MLLDATPRTALITHEKSGEQYHVATALVVMNAAADDGLTTGWYWTRVPAGAKLAELTAAKRWRTAAARHQGPFRDANAALAGAEAATAERAAVAILLRQAAEAVLAAETPPDAEAIGRWIATHELVLKARGGTEPPPPAGPDPGAKPPDLTARRKALLANLREAEVGHRPEADGEPLYGKAGEAGR